MASISNKPGGTRVIQFVGADKKRRTVRLGKTTKRNAKFIKSRIEALNAASIAGISIDGETATWVGGLEAALYDKLANVRLLPKRAESQRLTLAAFIHRYVAGRSDVKPATKEVWRQGEKGLLDFFGGERSLGEVTPGSADQYKLKLTAGKLAPMTVRKRLQFARMIFRAAVRQRLIEANPFEDVSVRATMPDRRRFISQADTAKLLEACPDHNWRLIIALARYGGLRCPSEVLSLRWQDIDWHRGRMVVRSPKTEHHAGKERRTVPLFDELRPYLDEAYALAPDGAVYVVDEHFRKRAQGRNGWRNVNLRTTFQKIIERAGLTAWPRIFHNLRSSRQTELAQRHPSYVVCEWLGNSEDIARAHYLQVTEEHFARECSALQKALQHESEPVGSPKQLTRNAAKIEQMHGSACPEADGEGFEPPVPLRIRQFSRLLP